MASDWLAAQLPANQKPSLKSLVKADMEFQHNIFLVHMPPDQITRCNSLEDTIGNQYMKSSCERSADN